MTAQELASPLQQWVVDCLLGGSRGPARLAVDALKLPAQPFTVLAAINYPFLIVLAKLTEPRVMCNIDPGGSKNKNIKNIKIKISTVRY